MIRSQLVVDVAADSLQLLSIEEMRAAAEISGSASDSQLKAMGLEVAQAIMSECNIAVGKGAEHTLWQETLVETFYWVLSDELLLSRRHDIELLSVVAGGVILADTEYQADPESGIMHRLCGDRPMEWRATRIVVTYKAGFEAIPGDLKMAASEFFKLAWQNQKRDLALRSEVVDVPDVLRTEKNWWIGSVPGQSSDGAVPASIAGKLRRFRNIAIG
ncbi:hypothetical protein GGQ99_004790 [Aminobacter niigataensis]|uniref:Uncharacterized protein n=1 Tax=Aminobacter niigataensis TaxID=83265 RepID=A0ABR6L874_9HYPH|nr:hypothetical protein [Aminobacter niigataensis]MBB4653006.1 hypothetical protein [Aminobacter niigataensis]